MRDARLSVLPAVALACAVAGCRAQAPTDRVRVSGHVEAIDVQVSPEVGGRLVDLRVDEGDRVKAGDLIARLDTRDTELAIARVRAERAQADAQLRLLRAGSTLGEAQAVLVVQIAKTQAAALGGTENYLVTRRFRELSTREQRVELLRCLFAVAAADQTISHLENTEITAVGLELGFSREEIAAVRAGFRDQLSVLKA